MFYIWIYRILSLFLLFASIIFLILRKIITKKAFGNISEKLGFLNFKAEKENNIWIHAVSYGEVKTITPFVKKLYEEFPDKLIFLTVGTETGYTLAQTNCSNYAKIFYAPFDFYFCVKNFFKAFKAEIIIITETEIWFEFLFQAKNLKCLLVNARLTDKSTKLYNLPLIKNFMQIALKSFSLILCQSQYDLKRFLNIGADPNKLKVINNLKFDSIQIFPKEKQKLLKASLNITENNLVLIAGSTHEEEDFLILKIYAKLKLLYKNIYLILAPRHLERIKEINKLIAELNIKDLFIVNSMGQLNEFYSISNIVLLGGTWVNIGGHNPLEPAIYGLPILTGKYTYKITELLNELKEKLYIKEIQDSEDLYNELKNLIENYKKLSINNLKFKDSNLVSEEILKELKKLILC